MTQMPLPPQAFPPPFVPPAQKSAWPTAMGVIYLIVAAWALWAFLSALLQPLLMGVYDKLGTGKMFPDWYFTALAITGIIAGAAGSCVLVGAIKLLRRRPGASVWMFTFAALFLVYAIVSAVVQFKGMSQMDFTAAMPPGRPRPPGYQPMMKSMMGTLSVFSAVFGFLFHAAPAAFAIIWFNRAKVRAEMENWKSGVSER